MTPHKPIQIGVSDASFPAYNGPVASREPLDDLLRVHIAQYTYPSEECNTHMSTAPSQNGDMREKEIRQTLARNVADRMQRDPALDTQAKLAARSKIAQPHISRILRGTSGATVDRVAALARALGCQPWELLVDTELTRQAALRNMILGKTVPDERVAAALGEAPRQPLKRR